MSWKGSLVLKRRHLLNMKANLDAMWRSNLSDGSRSHLFGQMSLFDRLLENDELNYRWDDFMQHQVWNGNYCTCPPSKTFEWLFDPTPLKCEEELETLRLLNHLYLIS